MEMRVIYDPEFSVNYVDCDIPWVDIEIYDDGYVNIELDPLQNYAMFTSEQLRMLADYADQLCQERNAKEEVKHEN